MGGSKRFIKEFCIVMGLYAVLLPLSLTLLSEDVLMKGWTLAIALMPALPLLGLIAVIAREIQQMDELQQKILVLSLAITLGITGCVTTVLGFLENAGLPAVSVIYVFPFMVTVWGMGNIILSRRYR